MGQAALVRTESLDFPSPGAAGATSQTLPDHLSSVRPELGGLPWYVSGRTSLFSLAYWRGPGCLVRCDVRAPILGDWKSLLRFCWLGPGDCFLYKAIGGTSVGPFAKPQGKIQESKAISIKFQIFFSIGTFFFFFKTTLAPNMLPKAMFRLFLDHYSEVLQLYSSQSGLGLLG